MVHIFLLSTFCYFSRLKVREIIYQSGEKQETRKILILFIQNWCGIIQVLPQTALKMKFFVKNYLSKCEEIRIKLQICFPELKIASHINCCILRSLCSILFSNLLLYIITGFCFFFSQYYLISTRHQ